jgi:ligand-binding sensor domain-containing protein
MLKQNYNRGHFCKRINYLLLFGFLTLSSVLFSQNPHHIVKDDESGLPSNEVYSIVQDKNGFLWLGSDAGLYRFNGIRFQHYKCKSQASKSISGLCFSPSGRLYCYNFKGQLFSVVNDQMTEIKHAFEGIQDITTDKNGNVVLNHNAGIALWNEKTKTWKNYDDFGVKAHYVHQSFTKSARNSNRGVFFVSTLGLGNLSEGKLTFHRNPAFKGHQLGAMILANSYQSTWMFSSAEPLIYKFFDQRLNVYRNKKLEKLLAGRKITNVRFPGDGSLWICTYTGVIKFHPSTGDVQLFYPQYSFSDVLRDKEGKYWFSTLHNGLLFVPNFRSLVWNEASSGLGSEKITKITSDSKNVYFATGNGQLGEIDQTNHQLKLFNTRNSADIQTLYFDRSDDCLYFSQSNIIFSLKNSIVETVAVGIPSVKKMVHFRNKYCFASSGGLFISQNTISSDFEIVNRVWNRDLLWLEGKQELWTATNEGIFVYELKNGNLKLKSRLNSEEQILSLAYDPFSKRIYALTFEGMIIRFNPNKTRRCFANLNDFPQVNNLVIHQNKLLVCSSKGLVQYYIGNHIHEPTVFRKEWTTSDGLASNNISEISVANDFVWIAGGRGVQLFSVSKLKEPGRGKIFLQKLMISGRNVDPLKKLRLENRQGITLFPESNLISEFGNFQYAYRFKHSDGWHEVAGTSEQIYIPAVPEGDFEMELKLHDNYGRDSNNIISIKGYLQPPFYRTSWFFILVVLVIL